MPFWFNRSCLEGILSSNQVAGLCIGVLGEIRSLKHGIMVLCGLDLREHRREAVLVHWVDSKLLLRFLLHCHSYCSYWQRGLERGMWQSRCNLSCTSWPSVGGPTPIFWRTVGMCFVLHTGRLMSGVCGFSSVTRLWVSPEPGEPVLCTAQCWNGHQAQERWHSLRAVGSGFFTCCWLPKGYTYTLLALWLYVASLPVTHRFLGHHTD